MPLNSNCRCYEINRKALRADLGPRAFDDFMHYHHGSRDYPIGSEELMYCSKEKAADANYLFASKRLERSSVQCFR